MRRARADLPARRRRRAAFLLAIFLSAPAAADGGTGLAGPADLDLTARIATEYNDNVTFRRRGDDDFATILAAGLRVVHRTRRGLLSLSGENAGVFFARSDGDRDPASVQQARLYVSQLIAPRIELTILDKFTRNSDTRSSATRASEDTEPDPGGDTGDTSSVAGLVRSGDILSNVGRGQLSFRLAPRWRTTAEYAHRLGDFGESRDRYVSHRVEASVEHDLYARLSVSGAYAYERFDFRHTGTDLERHGFTLGFRHRITPTWEWEASLGPSFNRSIEADANNPLGATEPTYEIAIARRGPKWSLRAGARRQITDSAGVAGASLTHGAFVRYVHRATDRLSLSVITEWTDFDTSTSDFWATAAAVAADWSLTDHLSARFEYRYRHRDSQDEIQGRLDGGTVDGNLISLSLRLNRPIARAAP